MKTVQNILIVLFSLYQCSNQLAASSCPTFTHVLTDTIPQVKPKYSDNRLIVKSIKIIKKKGKSYKIEYKIVNNGRNKVKLGKPNLIPHDLLIQFDKSLEENELIGAKQSIIESIKKKTISLRPGQLILRNKMKFTYFTNPDSDRKENEISKYKESIVQINDTDKEFLINENLIPGDHKSLQSKLEKSKKEVCEETPVKSSNLENPRFLSKPNQPKEKISHKKLENKVTEPILGIASKEYSKINVAETEINDPKIKKEPIKEEQANRLSKKKTCADLIIDEVKILRKNKRFVLLKYTIKNVGNTPISLHGETNKEIDNIAIQSHFTRSHNLTRGSIPVDISFIKKGNRDAMGMIVPGESITLKLKLETIKVTKFTPVLALTLNPLSNNIECNKLNNVFFIDIAEKAPEAINSKPKKSIEEISNRKLSILEN